MGRNDKDPNQSKLQKNRGRTRSACEDPKDRKDVSKKKGWSDVFDKLTYSSGPGENIYVFG